MEFLEKLGQDACAASYVLSTLSSAIKNQAILAIADDLEKNMDKVLEANARDVERAGSKGMNPALLDRLTLTVKRIADIVSDTRNVAKLPDPVGSDLESRVLPNGLRLTKRRIPIGVIGVIYEARPNVTVDIASLCLKTGNACILRGGSETIETNRVLIDIISRGAEKAGIPARAVQFIDRTDHETVAEFLKMDQYIDMIIPRGGARLSKLCREQSTIPVIIGGFGISHIYVDETADLQRSVPVIINSKVQKPSACNALDTLLVNSRIAPDLLKILLPELKEKNVRVVADVNVIPLLQELGFSGYEQADETSYDTEWLSLTMSVKVVDNLDEALEHMRIHNASHSDAILTNNMDNACRFVNSAGSAAVYVNSSTRFTDGGQFGLGAEVAISTQKLHARGPMGLCELTTYKWICQGDYLARS